MANYKNPADLGIYFNPKSENQQLIAQIWPETKILFLVGPAGTGKTHTAMGLALRDLVHDNDKKLLLCRPTVACDDEDLGFLPGDLNEKLEPWLAPFRDVFSSMSFANWEEVKKVFSYRLENVAVAHIRGRTIKDAILLCDEASNLTFPQIKCILSRLGKNGKIIFCGDPEQSDLFAPKDCPLAMVSKKLEKLEGVNTVVFDAKVDQMRDPLVTKILSILGSNK